MASITPASLFIILFLHFGINFATGFQDDDVDNSLFEQINDKLDRFRPIVVNTWNVPRATSKAWESLSTHNSSIDAIVSGCSICEDGSCGGSIGLGGSPDENGETTLDAMIMDGKTMDVGSVGCLREVQNAIEVARDVMRYTKHTLLVGELASDFAVSMGYRRKSLQRNSSYNIWQSWLKHKCQPNFWQNVHPNQSSSCGPYKPNSEEYKAYASQLKKSGKSPRYNKNVDKEHHDTIGMVAIDSDGNIASGTTTNGANHKIPGRVGDSPVVGAGSYAENDKGAAAATGDGDVMMRFLPSYLAVQLMGMGKSPTDACQIAIANIAKFYPNNYGAMMAINQKGEHGGACHKFGSFPYNVKDDSSGDVQVFTVKCT